MKSKYFFLLAIIFALGCKTKEDIPTDTETQSAFKYVTKLTLNEEDGKLNLKTPGSTVSFNSDELPLNSIMVIPTSVISYLAELGLTDKITGISQPDFIFNPEVHQLINDGKTDVIGGFEDIYMEKVLINRPDIFISITSPTLAKYHEQLEKEGIKVLLIDEYEEIHPLAKAEYLKVFGKLFGKETEADNLFEEIENNYADIRELTNQKEESFPTILANQIYGDVWYLPGGRSFQNLLFRDAGGNYLWSDDNSGGSLNLSFEAVFEKAGKADIWMNAGDFSSKKKLLASYPNYEWFESFKTGKIYNWNKRKSKTGANDYFETGVVRPDWVLKDLASIFHPDLFPEHELFFYKRLE